MRQKQRTSEGSGRLRQGAPQSAASLGKGKAPAEAGALRAHRSGCCPAAAWPQQAEDFSPIPKQSGNFSNIGPSAAEGQSLRLRAALMHSSMAAISEAGRMISRY